jgi:hypothetical protein
MREDRLIAFALLGLVMFRASPAQARPDQTAQPQEALEAIHQFAGCLGGLSNILQQPPSQPRSREDATAQSELKDMRLNLDRIVNGLVSDWGKLPQEAALARMPVEYLAHLEAITKVCEGALAQARRNPAQATRAAVAFARDLALKVDDCKKFDMGRVIPVEIKIIKDGVPDAGWSVYYKWQPGSEATAVVELLFPAPTPGAMRGLPPGLYVVRGEKALNGKLLRTAPVPVPVGGTDRVVFSITAP